MNDTQERDIAFNAFTIEGRQYFVRPFDVDTQLSLCLKLSPLFLSMMAAAPHLASRRAENGGRFDIGSLFDLSGPMLPVSRELQSLEKSGQARMIIDACLRVAGQEVDGRIVPAADKIGRVAFPENRTFGAKVQIAANVLWIAFGGLLNEFGFDPEDFVATALGMDMAEVQP